MEDYEQKYNEALERAKKAYQDIKPENTAVKKMLEEAFPELRESERIRKKIVDIVKAAPFDEEKDVLLDYLEKQKEQKPLPGSEDCDGIPGKDYIPVEWFDACERYGKWKIVEQEPVECIPDSIKFDEGFKTGREVGFREGVESVKPAEWSEEDERMIQSIVLDLQGFIDCSPNPPGFEIRVRKEQNFLKSLPEKIK